MSRVFFFSFRQKNTNRQLSLRVFTVVDLAAFSTADRQLVKQTLNHYSLKKSLKIYYVSWDPDQFVSVSFCWYLFPTRKKVLNKTFARWKWEEIQWEGKFNNFIKLDFKFPVISAELCRSILKNSWISKNVRHFVCLEHGIINVRVKVHILYSNISTKESLYVHISILFSCSVY